MSRTAPAPRGRFSSSVGSELPPRASRLLAVLLLAVAAPASAQEFGHKLLGTLGLNAGSQPDPGIYAGDRFIFYSSDRLIDRNGNPIPLPGFDLGIWAN